MLFKPLSDSIFDLWVGKVSPDRIASILQVDAEVVTKEIDKFLERMYRDDEYYWGH